MLNKSTALLAAGALAVVAVGAGATVIIAADGEEEGVPSSPGTPYNPTEAEVADESLQLSRAIETSGTYDDTVLTKFIPGSAFIPNTSADDTLNYTQDGRCVWPGANADGLFVTAFAPVELPDGARINQLRFFGRDDNAADIVIRLRRENFAVPLLGAPTRSDETVDSFNTSAVSGEISLSGAADLNEVVGSFRSAGATVSHRFHTVEARMTKAASFTHQVCGVEVLYQVPAADEEPGSVFFPIDPVRAYDSRNSGFPVNGLLAPNQSRTIPVKDGYTGSTVTTPDAVPADATAVTYNVTVTGLTGANFAAITPGDAAGFTASALNWNGTADIANAGTVTIDANRQIKVWAGDQPGSFQFIIDITGYYAPPTDSHPNMGN